LKIVFCTTCKGRAQHLKLTLPKNLADNIDYADAKFLILNYASPDDLMEYLTSEHAAAIASGRLVVYTYPQAEVFRMAHAKNLAHRLGILEGGEILVNLDADNYTGPGFAAYIAQMFQRRSDIFLGIGQIKRGITPRGLCGRIVVTAHAFLNAGGYDERFETWSPDDKDFSQRLRCLGYELHVIDERFMDCVRHNDRMRFREYPHARDTAYEDVCARADLKTGVVNFGSFGQGVVFRHA
jgi:hypothetical protein